MFFCDALVDMPPLPQDPADKPKVPSEGGSPPLIPGEWSDMFKKFCHAFGKRLGNFLVHFISVAIVSIALIAVFEYLAPEQDELHNFQKDLFQSVSSIKPAVFLDYIFSDVGGYVFAPIRAMFDNTLGGIYGVIASIEEMLNVDSHGLVDLLLNILAVPIVLVVVVAELLIVMAVLALCLVLSPIILPIAVLTKGSFLDGLLVILVFIPAMQLVFRLVRVPASDISLGIRAGFLFVGTLFALEFTTLLYVFLKYAMLAALWVFGEFVPLAPTGVLASGIGVFGYECAKKTVEESVVDRIAGFLRRAVGLVE